MANEVLQKVGTQLVFADHAGDYVGGTLTHSLELAGSTDVQLAPGALGALAARQSTQADLGATRAASYSIMMSLEMATDPVAGETVDLYWAPSVDSTAGDGNTGGTTGVDGAYVGYPGPVSTLAEGLADLMYIGSMHLAVMNDADDVHIAYIGKFFPPDRYGSLVVVNGSAADVFHSDDVEFAVSFQPIVTEVQ